jgi:branched-chain amino acid aminotransferase
MPSACAYSFFCSRPLLIYLHSFEGMKAYRSEDGTIRLFRPDMNMARMNRSAARIALPEFDPEALTELIKKLVLLDSKWIPSEPGYSLYLRKS